MALMAVGVENSEEYEGAKKKFIREMPALLCINERGDEIPRGLGRVDFPSNNVLLSSLLAKQTFPRRKGYSFFLGECFPQHSISPTRNEAKNGAMQCGPTIPLCKN